MNCPICHERYNLPGHIPRILPECSHSLCQNCCLDLFNRFETISCPLDRIPHKLSNESISNLPVDYNSLFQSLVLEWDEVSASIEQTSKYSTLCKLKTQKKMAEFTSKLAQNQQELLFLNEKETHELQKTIDEIFESIISSLKTKREYLKDEIESYERRKLQLFKIRYENDGNLIHAIERIFHDSDKLTNIFITRFLSMVDKLHLQTSDTLQFFKMYASIGNSELLKEKLEIDILQRIDGYNFPFQAEIPVESQNRYFIVGEHDRKLFQLNKTFLLMSLIDQKLTLSIGSQEGSINFPVSKFFDIKEVILDLKTFSTDELSISSISTTWKNILSVFSYLRVINKRYTFNFSLIPENLSLEDTLGVFNLFKFLSESDIPINCSLYDWSFLDRKSERRTSILLNQVFPTLPRLNQFVLDLTIGNIFNDERMNQFLVRNERNLRKLDKFILILQKEQLSEKTFGHMLSTMRGLSSLSVDVYPKSQNQFFPALLRTMSAFRNLQSFDFNFSGCLNISERSLLSLFAQLQKLDHLQDLRCNLSTIELGNQFLTELTCRCKFLFHELRLLSLNLTDTFVGDEGMARLCSVINKISHFQLSLMGTRVTNKLMDDLIRLKFPPSGVQYFQLSLSETEITDFKIAEFLDSIGNLESFQFHLSNGTIIQTKDELHEFCRQNKL